MIGAKEILHSEGYTNFLVEVVIQSSGRVILDQGYVLPGPASSAGSCRYPLLF